MKENRLVMKSRFYSANEITSATATLSDQEAHHLLHVMRGKVGDEVTLFDGSGWEFAAKISQLGRSDVTLEVTEKKKVDRERQLPLTIAVALPKGDRQRVLIEKCVELGVTTVIPLATERSVAMPKDKSLEKLRRAVIEASKQCGRNRLMEIPSGMQLEALLQQPPGSESQLRVLADPAGAASLADLTSEKDATPNSIVVAIGPEGGFSESELEMAEDAAWRTLNLGPRILRIETAAIALAARL